MSDNDSACAADRKIYLHAVVALVVVPEPRLSDQQQRTVETAAASTVVVYVMWPPVEGSHS